MVVSVTVSFEMVLILQVLILKKILIIFNTSLNLNVSCMGSVNYNG